MTDPLRQTHLIRPEWPAPPNVRAACTTRLGGVSEPPRDTMNLGFGSKDDPGKVRANRQRLASLLGYRAEPAWLQQVHGTTVVPAETVQDRLPEADASHTRVPGQPCVAITADCMPVLFCDRQGTVVAAAHAGWRGLAAGVLEATVEAMAVDPRSILAWMGPAIGPEVFEVGPEVREAFLAVDPAAKGCFKPSPAGRWLADLYGLGRQRLTSAGVGEVFGGGFCTHSDTDRFFSYRRTPLCGRMASLIWLD